MTPLISLRDIAKSFGKTIVLDGIDLDIYPGEALAIIGPSGTGKSTILKIMSGLLTPDRGEVWINGERVDGVGGTDSVHVGMVFQQAALFDSLTVAENVGFALFQNSCLKPPEILEIVSRNLSLVGLTGILDRYPSQLSGGCASGLVLPAPLRKTPNVAQLRKRSYSTTNPLLGLIPLLLRLLKT